MNLYSQAWKAWAADRPYADHHTDNYNDGHLCGYVRQLQRTRSRRSVVGVVITVRAGLPWNCGSVTGKDKRLFLQSLQARSASYPSFYSVGTDGFTTVYVERLKYEAGQFYLVLSLRMSTATDLRHICVVKVCGEKVTYTKTVVNGTTSLCTGPTLRASCVSELCAP